MPKVRFLTPVATSDRSYHEREVADIPGPVASAWSKSGNVEILRGPDAEQAEQPPAVQTVETPEGAAVAPETPERPRKRAAKKSTAKKKS